MPSPDSDTNSVQIAELALQSALGSGIKVDRDAGVIHDVAILTAGTTRVSGNGMEPFDVDDVSLSQVADAINASELGVKSRLTHPELEGVDDITRRKGYVRNARVIAGVCRGDMYFHSPNDPEAVMLMDIAEKDPTSCGLSIKHDRAILAESNTPTGLVLRVDAVQAVDWVGEPAGNPAGLLSAYRRRPVRINLQESIMNEKQKEFLRGVGLPYEATDEETAAFIEALSDDQKAQFAALKETPEIEAAAAEAEAAGGAATPSTPAEPPAETPVAASVAHQLTEGRVREIVAEATQAETDRCSEIRSIALRTGQDEAWIEKHIRERTPINSVRRIALDSLDRSPDAMPTSQVTVGRDLNRDTLNQAVQDAIFLRANQGSRLVDLDERGIALRASDGSPKLLTPHERANEFRGRTLIDMGRRYLVALGYQQAESMYPSQLAELLMNRQKLQAALPGVYLAHSTADFPYILADSMGKVLRRAYALAPSTYQQWCNITTAPDFKDQKKVQLGQAPDLIEIPENDEYTFGTLTESRETYALSTYGVGLLFSRRMLLNDDLSAFDRIPTQLGIAASRKVEGLAIAILTANANMADGNALFSTAHANITTGALSVTSLGAARAAMRKQTALGSTDPLEITPAHLLVPENKFTDASQLVSSQVDPSKSNATPNPFVNAMSVIPSARLDTDSTTQWYLIASPAEIDTVDVCFLEGQETPQVMEEDEFNNDARKVKVRQEAVAKAIEWRGLIRSSGS